jgi:hypothetical protein
MSQQKFEADLRASQDYRDAMEIIDAIEVTKCKLALLNASLKNLGDAASLARIDVLQRNLMK